MLRALLLCLLLLAVPALAQTDNNYQPPPPGRLNVIATGTNQSGAKKLPAAVNVVSSVPSGSGVRPESLPTTVTIVNDDPANTLLLYPPPGDQIIGYAVNSPASLLAGQQATMTWFGTALDPPPHQWVLAGVGIGTASLNGGGNITNLGFFVAPDTVALGAGGSGYVAADMVTLACPGANFSVAPNIAVTTVSSTVVTSVALSMPRAVSSTANAGTVTCTQSATTGTGVGLTVTLQFTPQDPDVSVMQLTNGGAVNNGNMFINNDTVSTTYAGAEGTFVGDKAGGAFSGIATGNTAFGHDACGIYYASAPGPGTVPTGGLNTCIGDDAGRDINGSAASNTLVGQGAGELVSGNSNTVIGEAAGAGMTTAANSVIVGQNAGSATLTGTSNTILGAGAVTGGTSVANGVFIGAGAGGSSIITGTSNTVVGQGAGTKLTSSAQNTIIGNSVASTTLATGGGNVIIGTSNACDSAASASNNSIRICTNGGLIWSTSGASSPAAAISTFQGDNTFGSGANLASLSVTTGFLHFPFTNATSGSGGVPTGTPATINGDACVWNDVTFVLNCYSASAAAWKHVAFSAAAG